jgi:hypothetical protein
VRSGLAEAWRSRWCRGVSVSLGRRHTGSLQSTTVFAATTQVGRPSSRATTTASTCPTPRSKPLTPRHFAPKLSGARDVQRDAAALPPSAPAAVEQFELRWNLCQRCRRRVFDQEVQRGQSAAAARPGPAAMSVLRLQGRRRQRRGEERLGGGGFGREQRKVLREGARAARGKGPAGVAEWREVPHRLQAAGVAVPYQAGEVPQRVPAPPGSVGEGHPLVAEFSILCQVRCTNHLFDVCFNKVNISVLNNVPVPFWIASGNARQLLSECVTSHLRHKGVTTEYGSRLHSSGGRILLQSSPGIKQQGCSADSQMLLYMLGL